MLSDDLHLLFFPLLQICLRIFWRIVDEVTGWCKQPTRFRDRPTYVLTHEKVSVLTIYICYNYNLENIFFKYILFSWEDIKYKIKIIELIEKILMIYVCIKMYCICIWFRTVYWCRRMFFNWLIISHFPVHKYFIKHCHCHSNS